MKTFKVRWEESLSVIVKAKNEEEAIAKIHGSDYDEGSVTSELSSYPEAFEIKLS